MRSFHGRDGIWNLERRCFIVVRVGQWQRVTTHIMSCCLAGGWLVCGDIMKHIDIDSGDARFFSEHPERNYHIREPAKAVDVVIDKQRAAHVVDEMEAQFLSLGTHDKKRRRVLIWRVGPGNPFYNPDAPQLIKVPIILFDGEECVDSDDCLGPILHHVMMNVSNSRST